MDEDFSIEEQGLDGVVILSLTGNFDTYTAPEVRERLVGLIDARKRTVVVLTDVRYIDSAGMGTLVGAMKRAAHLHDGLLKFVLPVHPADPDRPLNGVRYAFDITGIGVSLGGFNSLAEAIKDFSG